MKFKGMRKADKDAPQRWQKAIEEMTTGYSEHPGLENQWQAPPGADFVISSKIHFSSLCRHHLFPFFGVVSIGYRPQKYIVGLSKLARTVEVYSKRFQTQEDLTSEISNRINLELSPAGIGVAIEATHTCQCCRGIKARGSTTITTGFLGELKENEKQTIIQSLKI